MTQRPKIAPLAGVDPNTSAEALAERLIRDEPALLSSLDFGPLIRQGTAPGPRLIIGDQAAIELYTTERAGLHDHRMALLAEPGDTVVVRQRETEFEDYLARYLRLQSVSFVQADSRDPTPVAQQCRTNSHLAAAVANALPTGGPLTLHAYLMTGHVWRLAAALSETRQDVVHVAGPGPRISRRANDKLWFWTLARQVAGRDAVPPTLHAYGPAAAAAHVRRLAKLFPSVVVKVPSSAGGAGNVRFASAVLQTMSLAGIHALLRERLIATGWKGTYPILVGVWEVGVVSSPSAQMWLPRPSEGTPDVLGLFEQRVEQEVGTFVGARPAQLDSDTAQKMQDQAIRIGAVLQRLGYYGACSLDAVIRDTAQGGRELHWIECNGRWSGVSIPFAAIRALLGGTRPGGLVIVQEVIPDAVLSGTSALCALLDTLLFRAGTSSEGIVIVSPPNTPNAISFNIMAVAEDQTRAEALASEARRRVQTSR